MENCRQVNLFNKKNLLLMAMMIISIYFSPYLLYGENVHVRVTDELDFLVSNLKMVAESGHFLKKNTVVGQMMNGLPFESLYYNKLNITVWLFLIFEPFTAYVMNNILVHIIAFLGMYLLLSKHVLSDKYAGNELIIVGSSLCFALLPFYSIFGLSVAGQPLLYYAFLNIRNSVGRFKDYIFIALYSLCSLFVFSGLYILPFLFILLIFDFCRKGKVNKSFALVILFFITINALINYSLISPILFPSDIISHRVEMRRFTKLVFDVAINRGLDMFFYNGPFHTQSLHFFILRLIVPIALFAGLLRKAHTRLPVIIGLIIIAFLFSLWYGIWSWEGMLPLKDSINILHYFDASRFHFLLPVLWFVVMGIALSVIIEIRYGRWLVVTLILLQLCYSFANDLEFSTRIDSLIGKDLNNKILRKVKSRVMVDRHPAPQLTYQKFFSEELFTEIEKYINRPKKGYRIASIGLHPSITHYNGFFTLDGYSYNYPLAYKHQFRKVIAKELQKMPKVKRDYFDEWGGRCYIFADELYSKLPWYRFAMITKNYSDKNKIMIENLEVDTKAFKKMGGVYIFSAVKILNSDENRLKFLKAFENKESPWRIYIYEAI